ncbi:MAG: IS630 family transposase [Cyanobacteria bacterium P01_C01_bin.120]
MGQLTSVFIAKMEHLLALYVRPYAPRYPVVCFDERPCFLIGEVIKPLPGQAGQVAKEHYADEKNGSCSLLAAIEPLTGRRLAQVHTRRTKREYTQFCQALAAQCPEALQIQLVQDNLNTHNASAFYEYLPAEDAFALAQRFEFHYTPKSASWLNMIEIEFSALARGCLHQRIPTQARLEQEVLALVQERHDQRIRIHWQFSLEAARDKFQRHYAKIQADKIL